MTHPFHPLTGREFELAGYAHTWGEHRVFYREAGGRLVLSLPASWTNIDGPDLFFEISAGRSHFKVEDLLALSELLSRLMDEEDL